MTRRWSWAVAVVLLMTVQTNVADAEHKQVESLRSLQGVVVTVDLNAHSDLARRSISRDSIQSHVELRLRRSGIRVLNANVLTTTTEDFGILEVIVTAGDIPESRLIVVETMVELRQELCFVPAGKPMQSVFATTWDEGGVGLKDPARLKAEGVKIILDVFVDNFVSAWLGVHPR